MRNSRIPLYYMLFTIILSMLLSCSRQLPEKPNIVLYLADDLSWWDLEQWMMEQGDLGMDSELAVPLWKRKN